MYENFVWGPRAGIIFKVPNFWQGGRFWLILVDCGGFRLLLVDYG